MEQLTSFDQILTKYTGGHGKFQMITTIYIGLMYCGGLHIFFYNFTAYAPPHRCLVPSCEANNQSKVSRGGFTIVWVHLV